MAWKARAQQPMVKMQAGRSFVEKDIVDYKIIIFKGWEVWEKYGR